MIKIRATHKLHNIVFQIKEDDALWTVISDCLQRFHIHYGLILKSPAGLQIEILEIIEKQGKQRAHVT